MTLRLDPGGPGNVLRVGPDSAEVGSDAPHFAGFHRKRPVRPATIPPGWWSRAAAGAALREGVARLMSGG